ncbi:hypothetical protein GCM10027299_25360 [Larkinella ripae]
MFQISNANYVVDYHTRTALYGPMDSQQAVDWINSQQENSVKYANESRYSLAKCGKYPRTRSGEMALMSDLEKTPQFELKPKSKMFGPAVVYDKIPA